MSATNTSSLATQSSWLNNVAWASWSFWTTVAEWSNVTILWAWWLTNWASMWWNKTTERDPVDIEVYETYQDVLDELETRFDNLDKKVKGLLPRDDKYNQIIADQRFSDFERFGAHKRRNAVTFAPDDVNRPYSFKGE